MSLFGYEHGIEGNFSQVRVHDLIAWYGSELGFCYLGLETELSLGISQLTPTQTFYCVIESLDIVTTNRKLLCLLVYCCGHSKQCTMRHSGKKRKQVFFK